MKPKEKGRKMGGKSVKMLKFLDNPDDKKAIDSAFAAYDTDHSGELEPKEIEQFAHQLVQYFIAKYPKTPAGDLIAVEGVTKVGDLRPLHQQIVAIQFATYLIQIMDKNGDHKISLREWEETDWKGLVTSIKNCAKENLKNVGLNVPGNIWKISLKAHPEPDSSDYEGKLDVSGSNVVSGEMKGRTVNGVLRGCLIEVTGGCDYVMGGDEAFFNMYVLVESVRENSYKVVAEFRATARSVCPFPPPHIVLSGTMTIAR